MMLKIWTARIDYKTDDANELVLDTTAKSAKDLGKVFAPEWEMVMASKSGEITWQQYTELYLQLMRDRYRKNKARFAEVCQAGEIVLLCYCENTMMTTKHCHRYLLADVLLKVAKKLEIEAKYMGERMSYKNRPPMEKKRHAKRTRNVKR